MSPALERFINLTGNLVTIMMGIIAAASYLHRRLSKASYDLPDCQPVVKKNGKRVRAKFEQFLLPTPRSFKKILGRQSHCPVDLHLFKKSSIEPRIMNRSFDNLVLLCAPHHGSLQKKLA